MYACSVCGNTSDLRLFAAREMMMGLREPFEYVECLRCQAVQIAQVPADLGRFYAAGYYSFNSTPSAAQAPALAAAAQEFVHMYFKRLRPTTRIMDVGCGSGQLVYGLAQLGAQEALGIDPFITQDQVFDNGARVLRSDLHAFDESDAWDIIMFNHSFEHLLDQRATLERARELLKPGGVILLRMPTVSSYAWHTYGRDWVALDAPRHTCLHSVQSMQILSDQTKLRVRATLYDSSAFQFIGSEQYRHDIPLYGPGSYFSNPAQSMFSQAQLQAFQMQAHTLNQAQQGDTAAWYLSA